MLSKYWKAAIAVLGVVATGLTTMATDPNVAEAVPAGWPAAILAGGAIVTGWATWGKRNQLTVDQIDAAIKAGEITVADLQNLIPSEPS